MIPHNKYVNIAKGLLEKTREGKVPWNDPKGDRRFFSVSLPNSAISIDIISPPTEPDFIRLTIYGPAGGLAGSWEVREGDEHWELASTLYSEVYRSATGWDKAFEDVERFIASDRE